MSRAFFTYSEGFSKVEGRDFAQTPRRCEGLSSGLCPLATHHNSKDSRASLVLLTARKRGAKAVFHLFVWTQTKELCSSFPGRLRANARKNRAKKQKQMKNLLQQVDGYFATLSWSSRLLQQYAPSNFTFMQTTIFFCLRKRPFVKTERKFCAIRGQIMKNGLKPKDIGYLTN